MADQTEKMDSNQSLGVLFVSIGTIMSIMSCVGFLLWLCGRCSTNHARHSNGAQQQNQVAVKSGLSEDAIGKLPVTSVASLKRERGDEEWCCAICIGKISDEVGKSEEEVELRVLPACGHCFHVECVDVWLASHSTCPSCRSNAAPPQQAQLQQHEGAVCIEIT